MRPLLPFALATASGLLCAQGVYFNSNKPGDPTCPKVEIQTDATVGRHQLSDANGGLVSWHQEAHVFIPREQRKDVSLFTAYDEKGKGTSIGSLKGKIVVVELWGANCDPSARMLMDLAQLYERRAKFNFEVLAVNFESNRITEDSRILGGWSAIQIFEHKNADFFRQHKLPFYVPGVGKEGASNFMDTVYSLPVLCVVDTEGRLASLDIGYEPQIVSKRLSQLIRDSQNPAAPNPPSQPAPVAPKPDAVNH